MKPQLKTLTCDCFTEHEPCYDPQEKYGEFSGTILDILQDKRIPDDDKIWAFTRPDIMDDKTLRLFAVRCARQVQHLMKDERSVNALDVADKYANDLATDEELEAARGAAWAARGAAETWAARAAATRAAAAWAAAWAATWAAETWAARAAATWAAETWAARAAATWAAAAWEAARAEQVQIAIELIKEFYQQTNEE